MKEYSKQMIFAIFFLLITANCAWSEAVPCGDELNICIKIASKASGVNFDDFLDLQSDDLNEIITRMGHFDWCKFYKAFNECGDKINPKCQSQIDDRSKKMIETFKKTEVLIQCGQPEVQKLIQLWNKCSMSSLKDSGITSEDLANIQPPTGGELPNPMALMGQLGTEKACKFLKNFMRCAEDFQKQNPTMPLTKESLAQVRDVYDKLNCGFSDCQP